MRTGMPAWLAGVVGVLLVVGGSWYAWAVLTTPRGDGGGIERKGPYRPEMVRLPAGEFMMGSPAEEKFRDDDEEQANVRITRPFEIGRTEVTQTQWTALMGTNPSLFKGDDSRPVERVNWFESLAYLNELSRSEGLEACYVLKGCTGQLGRGCAEDKRFDCDGDYNCSQVTFKGFDCPGYRLPTEAEWEYAARAQSTGPTYGDLHAIAWHESNSRDATHPVQTKAESRWRLHDMIGNVYEWTHDGYADALRGGDDPIGAYWSNASSRVARGCGWNDDARYCRARSRVGYLPSGRRGGVGLRPARSSRSRTRRRRAPYIWPTRSGTLARYFGKRGREMHKGIDIKAPLRTKVYAVADGMVIYSNNEQPGYGNLIIIRHARDVVSVYAHNRRNLVDEGDRVRQGAEIAEVGQTGRANTPHLHFELRVMGKATNPLIRLPASGRIRR